MKTKSLFLPILCLIAASTSHAQWVKTNGPDSVNVLGNAVTVIGDVLSDEIYGGRVGNVYLSTFPTGSQWTNYRVGSNDTLVLSIAMATDKTLGFPTAAYVFAGMSGKGIIRHGVNSDFTLTAVNTGLTNLFVHSLVFSGSNLYAGTENGIFLSTNSGGNWTAVGTGLTGQTVRAIAFNGANILVGTNNGVFLSTNGGTNWAPANNGLSTVRVSALVDSGNSIYAGTEGGGVFRSMNNATNWAVVNGGLTNLTVHTLTGYGQNVFAGTDSGVFLSTNGGGNWQNVSTGLTNLHVQALTVTSIPGYLYLYAGTLNGTWLRPLSELTTSIKKSPAGFSDHFSIGLNNSVSFSLPSKSFVSLKAFDLSGKSASILLSEELPAGMHTHHLNTAALPNGLYFLRLETDSFKETKMILLSR